MTKHQKIAIWLHCLNIFSYLGFGFFILVISQAFLACSASSSFEISCGEVLFVTLGIPFIISLIPIFLLVKLNSICIKLLWFYSFVLAIVLFPIGTAIGGHTMYFLKKREKET